MEQDKLQADIEKLEADIRVAFAAEEFFNQASGKLLQDLITKRVTLSIQKLSSTEYLKDHTGFVNENSWLRANQRILSDLQRLADPELRKRLRAKKDELEERNA